MPRDDLSIDFVKKMPQTEPMDPAVILDDWFNRVQNLPEEVRFIQDEIRDKDRSYAECLRIAEDRDAKIQKWYKNNGSHIPNPKEDGLKSQVRENYQKAEKIAAEKSALTLRLQTIMDKHLRSLDVQLKLLYDRAEPGFLEPDEVPSLLRQSPANKAASLIPTRNPNNLSVSTAIPLSAGASNGTPHTPTTARTAATQARVQAANQHAASAPVSPAASIMLNRNQRESSAGAPNKRPRLSTGVSATVAPSSSLARHSSLGPGTPKSTQNLTPPGAPNSAVRAGSAGPRSGVVKASGTTSASIRKSGTPSSGAGRKKVSGTPGNPKSLLSRVRKSTKTSPASVGGDSELSDAGSGSDMSEAEGGVVAGGVTGGVGVTNTGTGSGANSGKTGTGTPVEGVVVAPAASVAASTGPSNGGGGGVSAHLPGVGADLDEDEEMGDADYDEAGDNKKYCLCQKVSFGDMVACDNDDCPYEWFHWSCVGLESEPNGKWYCPVCEAKRKK